jgi:hypothetical protein
MIQDNQPKKGNTAYGNLMNDTNDIQDAEKQKKSEGTGNVTFDKKVKELNQLEGNALLGATAIALFKFLMRYIGFIFLGMLIPFQFFDKRNYTFSGLFITIAIGLVIAYALYCVYVYFIRTPFLLSKRTGSENKFYDYAFQAVEVILPSLALPIVVSYIFTGMFGSKDSSPVIGWVIAIPVAIFFYMKLKKEVKIDLDEDMPLLGRWIHNLSKKNNS